MPFRLPEVEGLERETAKGFLPMHNRHLRRAFVSALENGLRPGGVRFSPRRMQMALKASMFFAACAKVGLEALIDEATGYQIDRAQDALQVRA